MAYFMATVPPQWVGDLMDELVQSGTMMFRLVLAAACGALIGWQREKRDKAAGLRTHMLLAVGSCIFALVGLSMGGGDILRIVQGTLMGTGFICGGVIFRQGPTVLGLTTAVGLWSLSAIGVAAGVGEYALAVLATVLVFIVMAGFVRLEERRSGQSAVGPAAGVEETTSPAGDDKPAPRSGE